MHRLFGRLTRFDPPTAFMIAPCRKVHAGADIRSHGMRELVRTSRRHFRCFEVCRMREPAPDREPTTASASDAEIVAFLQWSLPRLGLRWEGFRKVRGTVRKRIIRRMAELGIRDLVGYRARLEATKNEWAALGGLCRIPISRFHRDRAVFERIRGEILSEHAEAAARAGRQSVRIWSAGCASGEEPYTISILWNLEIAANHPGVGMDLLATDIDETMIARAERGCYTAGSLRELPTTFREAAFEHDDVFWVRDEIRQGVTFRQEDMREVMPDGPFDLILCRNTAFTYFDEPTQRAVAARMIERLRERGVLVVGTHEAVPSGLEGLSLQAPCIYERIARN